MDAVPEMIPISKLRLVQNEVLRKLDNGPVVLAQRSKAAAVLVSPKQWNELLERLELLEDSLDAVEIKERITRGEEKVMDWKTEEAADVLPA